MLWQGLFLPGKTKSPLGETAPKVAGGVFRVADCPCLSRTGFGVLD